MKFEPKSIAIGVAAGLAAALLSVGSVVQTSLSIILFFIAPLPIMVAGLGWGPGAGAGQCCHGISCRFGFFLAPACFGRHADDNPARRGHGVFRQSCANWR